jgi:hypothetical protein
VAQESGCQFFLEMPPGQALSDLVRDAKVIWSMLDKKKPEQEEGDQEDSLKGWSCIGLATKA